MSISLRLPEAVVVDQGQTNSGLEWQILGTTFQAVKIQVPIDQKIFTAVRGGMSWMSGNIDLKVTPDSKNIMTGKPVAGQAVFTSTGGTGFVTFAMQAPGQIIALNLAADQEIVCQRGAFICGEVVEVEEKGKKVFKGVKLSDVTFPKLKLKNAKEAFGGAGFALQKLTGPGLIFLELHGQVIEHDLEPNQPLKVEISHLGMYESKQEISVEMVKGFQNVLLDDEGLIMATLQGPGRVWLQTLPTMKAVRGLETYLPSFVFSKK